MASFTGLENDMMDVVKACAGNTDKADTAAFLMAQYDLIRDEAYAAKTEGKAQEAKAASNSGSASNKNAAGDANSAFSRLQTMLKAQGQ